MRSAQPLETGSQHPMHKVTFQKEGHLYFNDSGIKVPSVSSILEHFGLSDFSCVDSGVLKAAQDFGTNVHETTAMYDLGTLGSCDPEVEKRLDQWIKFKEDYGIMDFDIIEQPLYSRIWGFAGTPDRVKKDILPDIKTGAKTVAHKIQTAFYKILIEENYRIKIRKRMSVYLTGKAYKVHQHKDRTDINTAKSLISIYNWKCREGLV